MMRTSNPAMNPAMFAKERTYGLQEKMTVQGTINKCFILFFLLLLTASWVWGKVMPQATTSMFGEEVAAASAAPAAAGVFIMFGGIAGLILALVTVFKKHLAKFTAPLYALCEGLVIGGISAIFE